MKHRQYISQNARFKEVVPFHDPALVTKIHQTFRLQYIKDVVLAKILDDGTCATINAMIFYNQIEIIGHIQNDESFQLALSVIHLSSISDITSFFLSYTLRTSQVLKAQHVAARNTRKKRHANAATRLAKFDKEPTACRTSTVLSGPQGARAI